MTELVNVNDCYYSCEMKEVEQHYHIYHPEKQSTFHTSCISVLSRGEAYRMKVDYEQLLHSVGILDLYQESKGNKTQSNPEVSSGTSAQ